MRGKPYLTRLTDRTGKLKSEYWYIEWYDSTAGRNKRRSTGDKIGTGDDAANRKLAAATLEVDRPTAKEPGQMVIAAALEDYYNEHAQHVASAKAAIYHQKRLTIAMGHMFVSHATKAVIAKYVRERQTAGESNGTIRRDLEHLQAALNHAVEEGRMTYAPKIKKPEAPEPRGRTLTEEEVGRLLAECKEDHLRNFVILMLNTGQRPAGIEQLKWFQVDFEANNGKGVINFDKVKRYKNKQARPVAMNSAVRQLLIKLFSEKQTEFVLERHFTKRQVSKPAGCVKKAFAAAVKRAGLENVGRYTLRHTVLDRVNDTADEKTSADIGGHRDARTTRKNYIKSKMEKQSQVLEGLWAKTTQTA